MFIEEKLYQLKAKEISGHTEKKTLRITVAAAFSQ